MFKVKRVVTGLNGKGQSTVAIDGPAKNTLEVPGWPGAYISELWTTNEMPVNNNIPGDLGDRPIQHDPVDCGSIFRVVEIPPEKSLDQKIDIDSAFQSIGSANVPEATDRTKHASMHFTNSIDYLVVISGEMYMLMEDGEVLLRQGDCIVQKGTKHAWLNKGDVPCILAAVLVDAIPVKSVEPHSGE
ncbi:cupin domain-containing protein [Kineobactrum salinum]|uniref:Cupin domain-containing protein n=1 Tax=Kineobactrum salinum TaxID=2708301 RepID=A0A6C0TYL4_9GAMM|nr:cupin domain-containing protein [Kineobactrum salinum]QIB64920.1 cupin domain-containing protein [Kineobactrum salinum]